MKKALLLLSLTTLAGHAAEMITMPNQLDAIASVFKSQPKEQQLEALMTIDPINDWVKREFPGYQLDQTRYIELARKINFKALVPELKEACHKKLPWNVQQYLEECARNNEECCQILVNKEDQWFLQHSNHKTMDMIKLSLGTKHYLAYYIASNLQNKATELSEILGN